MPMEEALVVRLTAGLGDDCVSWFGKPRGDGYPSTILSPISPGEEWTHAGPGGLEGPRVQFNHEGRTADDVSARARAATALMRQSADVADGLGATWRFHPARKEGELWIDRGEQDGGEALFEIQQDFIFYHERID